MKLLNILKPIRSETNNTNINSNKWSVVPSVCYIYEYRAQIPLQGRNYSSQPKSMQPTTSKL